jgi:hypothetical protein
MAQDSPVQILWRAARDGLAELSRRFAEAGDSNDMIFHAPPTSRSRERDHEQRILEAQRSGPRGDRTSTP